MIIIIKGLIFLTTLKLLGIYGLESFVIPPLGFEASIVSGRLRHWAKGALVGLLLATVVDMLLRSTTLAGSVAGGVHAIPPILMQMHVGHVWIMRGALVVALLVLEFSISQWKNLRLTLAMLLAVTIAVTGHAADHGDFTIHILMDSVHVVAAGLWVGGLFSLAIVLRGESEAMSPDTLARMISRFSKLAGYALLAVVIGGAFNTWISLPTIVALWSTTYGRVLSLKLMAVSLLVALGAVNRYVVLPRLKSNQAGAGVLFKKWLKREVWVALAVIGLTAILCETIPARHAGHVHENSVGIRR